MTDNLPSKPISKDLKESIAVDFALMQASSQDAPVYNERDICATWDITVEDLQILKRDPEFIRLVRSAICDLKKSGDHLQVKSRLILEAWMDNTATQWLADDGASISDKNKVVETLIKVSNLIRKDAGSEGSSSNGASAPTLNIILTSPTPMQVEKVVNG